jgi:hypothetical protein
MKAYSNLRQQLRHFNRDVLSQFAIFSRLIQPRDVSTMIGVATIAEILSDSAIHLTAKLPVCFVLEVKCRGAAPLALN